MRLRSLASAALALVIGAAPALSAAPPRSFVPGIPSATSTGTVAPVTTPDGAATSLTLGIIDSAHHRYTVPGAANVVNINQFGPAADGVTDDLPVFQAALNSFPATGGVLRIDGAKRYLIDSASLTIPVNVTIQGSADPTQQVNGDYTGTGSTIVLNPKYTINEGKSGLDHVIVYAKGLPAVGNNVRAAMNAIAAFSGTAITQTSDDAHNRNVLVLGFASPFTDSGSGRVVLDHFYFDCTNGPSIDNAHDVPHLNTVHGWPFLTGPVMGDTTATVSGVASNGASTPLYRVTTSSPFGATFTASGTAGSTTLTSVSSTTNVAQGQSITGPGIPSGTSIAAVGSNTITLSAALTAAESGQSYTSSAFVTGDYLAAYNIGGTVSANGKWPVTVIDNSHLDLQNTAPSTGLTVNTISGQNYLTVSNLYNAHIGQTITGTGIPSGAQVTDIWVGGSIIYISQAATATAQITATVSDPAYTSGGTLALSPLVRGGTGLTITHTETPNINDFFGFGFETCIHLGTGVVWPQFTGSACDADGNAPDPLTIGILADGTAAAAKWIGGSLNVASRPIVINANGGYPTLTMVGTTINTAPGSRTLIDFVKGSALFIGNDASGATINGASQTSDIFFNDAGSEMWLTSNKMPTTQLRVPTPTSRALVHTEPGNQMSSQDEAVTSANLSSCGTSPSVAAGGTKHSATVTEGGSATGCTVTFPTPYGNAPTCSVSVEDGTAMGFGTGLGVLSTSHSGNAVASNGTRTFTYVCGWQ